MYIKEILGKEVLDVCGNKIGKVYDMEADMVRGVISQVVIKAGLTKRHVIGVDEIVTIGDKVILRKREDELAKKS